MLILSLFLLLRISNNFCYVHEEPAAGLIQLLHMRLLHLYPKYRFLLRVQVFLQTFNCCIRFFAALKDMKHYTRARPPFTSALCASHRWATWYVGNSVFHPAASKFFKWQATSCPSWKILLPKTWPPKEFPWCWLLRSDLIILEWWIIWNPSHIWHTATICGFISRAT